VPDLLGLVSKKESILSEYYAAAAGRIRSKGIVQSFELLVFGHLVVSAVNRGLRRLSG